MEDIIKNILDKKEQVNKLLSEIEDLKTDYAHKTRKYNEGDVVTFKHITDTIFIVGKGVNYYMDNDTIYYDCTILSTTNPLYTTNKTEENLFSLPEIHLEIKK